MKLVAPNNRRKFDVIIVGTGLAGASAAATLGELGYNVKVFTYHDSPRRAHSIAAQGGINAAKNYKSDGDSVFRLFYDTVKGGDFRSREANVYRLAEESVNIIDQCVAQGVPFAREYGGLLDNRSFGGAQVSRTFYARGQTGQQLLLGAYQALMRQVGAGHGHAAHPHRDARPRRQGRRGRAASSSATWSPAQVSSHSAHAVLLCHRRLRQRLLPVDQRQVLQRHRRLAGAPAGRAVRQPLLHADPPDLHPGQRRVPVEAHADVASRCATTAASGCRKNPDDTALARPDPRGRARLLPRAQVPELRQPRAPRRGVPQRQDRGRPGQGRRPAQERRVPRLRRRPSTASARTTIRERYGNLFDMYERITDENPYKVPMRIYPAVHYTMGGLWVDYNLMSNVPGLFVLGEANFSDHGANRLGASALMQGLADGYFVIRYTIGQLPGRPARHRPGAHRRPRVHPGRDVGGRHRGPAAVDQRHPLGRPLPPRARQDHVGALRHGPQPGRAREGAGRDPRAARGVLEGRAGARRRRRSTSRSRRRAASPTSSSSAS